MFPGDGLAKSNNTDPDHFLCVPRKDPDYAPPYKLAKNAPKSPQALPYQYHQLYEATLCLQETGSKTGGCTSLC